MNIAIDGPAGAGKSTMARRLAGSLGILYLDTGAMYRAIGLAALRAGADVRSETAMDRLLERTLLDIRLGEDGQQVLLDGESVGDLIRTPEVSRAASDVSAVPCVRRRLVEMQRRIAADRDLVLDGRDIGTYVLPAAEYKFYLTATPEVRAGRRLADLRARGDRCVTFQDVLADVHYRDCQDSGRALAPLRQAEDALLIDTTELTPDQVVEKMLTHIKKATGHEPD